MKRDKVQEKKLKKLNRYYTIVKIFLMVTPFIAYLYLQLLASSRSVTLQTVLSEEPSVAVIFLIAMINPYIAYILGLVQKKLEEGNYKYVCLNFVILLIAQALTLNSVYFFLLAYLCYVTLKTYSLKMSKALQGLSLKVAFFDGGGSFVVMLFSAVCLFATLRLM